MSETLLSALGEGRNPRARRGLVLVIVLGILAILVMMITVFVTFQNLEKRVAINFVDDVRARLLAQSGIEEGISRISGSIGIAGPGAGTASSRFWGQDTDENTSTSEGGLGSDCPLDVAWNPSFAEELDGDPEGGLPTPRTLTIDGQVRGVSGVMATGSYGINSDIYSLRVNDSSSAIFVNEGLSHPYLKAQMERILNRLGDEFPLAIATLGTNVIGNRPLVGYSNVMEIKEKLKPFYSAAQLAQLDGMLSCRAWQDSNLALPVPLSYESREPYRVPTATASDPLAGDPVLLSTRPSLGGAKLFRYGRSARSRPRPGSGGAALGDFLNLKPMQFHGLGTGESTDLGRSSVYGRDELNARYIEVVDRAPVNINNASKPVLTALLMDLQGFFHLEQRRGADHYTTHMTAPYQYYDFDSGDPFYPTTDHRQHTAGEIGVLFRTAAVDAVMARTIAQEIIDCRAKLACTSHGGAHDYTSLPEGGPFGSWQQFHMFVDLLVDNGDGNNANDPINDPRASASYYVYPVFGPMTAGDPGSGSEAYAEYASECLGDAIKANFNPNLHLNELNPDLNLYLQVDKTDLIQQSTEFSLMPTGFFEIESLGRVLRPVGGIDSFTSDNKLAAEKKAVAVVRLYSSKRFTTQRDFYGDNPYDGVVSNFGVLSNSADGPTYMNYGLQIGPEVDQGEAPAENSYEGYVSLSTYGGSMITPTGVLQYKTRKSVVSTDDYVVANPVTALETIRPTCLAHAHFDLDFHLHESGGAPDSSHGPSNGAGTRRAPLTYFSTTAAGGPDPAPAPSTTFIEPPPAAMGYWNLPDRTEFAPATAGKWTSPYGPNYDPARYRLAWSYRWNSATSIPDFTDNDLDGAGLIEAAPSDLRMDGAFSEKNAAPLFIADGDNDPLTLNDRNFDPRYGATAYWVKPGFEPDFMGKERSLFNIDRGGRGYWGTAGSGRMVHKWIHGDFHGDGVNRRMDYVGTTPNDHYSGSTNKYKSMLWGGHVWGYSFTFMENYDPLVSGSGGPVVNWKRLICTPVLNHTRFSSSGNDAHQHAPVLKRWQNAMPHFWTHYVCSWKLREPADTPSELAYARVYPNLFRPITARGSHPDGMPGARMWVNGRLISWGIEYIDERGAGANQWATQDLKTTQVAGENVWWLELKDVPGSGVQGKPTITLDNMTYRRQDPYNTVTDANGLGLNKMVPIALGSIGYMDDQVGVTLGDTWGGRADKDGSDGHQWVRNFTSESTIDEWYIWSNTLWYAPFQTEAQGTFRQGRYYRKMDGTFDSPSFDPSKWKSAAATRVMAPSVAPSPPPGGTVGTALPVPGAASGSGTLRLLGVSWTVTGDPKLPDTGLSTSSVLRTYKYSIHDHKPMEVNSDPTLQDPQVAVRVSVDNGVTWGALLTAPEWSSLMQDVPAGNRIKFRVEISGNWDANNAILLLSPIFDDITFTFDDPQYESVFFVP